MKLFCVAYKFVGTFCATSVVNSCIQFSIELNCCMTARADAVPHSGVPANSVHTGGSTGRVGSAGIDDGTTPERTDESPDKAVEVLAVDGVVVVVVDDAPAPVTPIPIAPRDSDAPNSEAAIKR